MLEIIFIDLERSLQTVLVIIGAASVIVQALIAITRLPPAKKESRDYLNKPGKALLSLIIILDRLALNLPARQSRK